MGLESCEIWWGRLGFLLLHRVLGEVRKLRALNGQSVRVDWPIWRLVLHQTVLVSEDISCLVLGSIGSNYIILILLRKLRVLDLNLILGIWSVEKVLGLLGVSFGWGILLIDRGFPFVKVVQSIELVVFVNQLIHSLLGRQVIRSFWQWLRRLPWVLVQRERHVLRHVWVHVWLLNWASNSVGKGTARVRNSLDYRSVNCAGLRRYLLNYHLIDRCDFVHLLSPLKLSLRLPFLVQLRNIGQSTLTP